jgi:glycine dehydrogenase subunit 1
VGHYVPHTDSEIDSMLAFMGLSSLDDLFDVVPAAMRLAAGSLDMPDGLSEFETLDEMARLAAANRACGPDLVCFAGGGAYDHELPAAVKRVAFRSEFVTAYTPYQPEVAQGVLQTLFEYQTMIARLSGVEVANASLYDGASACVEGLNLAVAVTGRHDVFVSPALNPNWRQVVDTFAKGTGHVVHDTLPDSAGAILVQQPNYFGVIEDLAHWRAEADRVGALLIVAFDPVAAGLLRTPGSYGADVVVGEGQPFGTPLSFGGPYLGLFACKLEHVRRLPGRLVGETVDTEGRRAYVTTLRTREQDIRREKASSNVCTNQTLIAVCCAIQLGWLGTTGLRELTLRCARATRYTRESLLAIDGVSPLVDGPVLREFAVRTPIDPEVLVERMADEGFLAGVPVDGGLLVAATERRTRDEIDRYAGAFEKVVR